MIDDYAIFSHEHGAWWGPNRRGYTRSVTGAGVYPRPEAEEIRDHAYRGWSRGPNPPEVLVRAAVGVSPTMAMLMNDATDATAAGWTGKALIHASVELSALLVILRRGGYSESQIADILINVLGLAGVRMYVGAESEATS